MSQIVDLLDKHCEQISMFDSEEKPIPQEGGENGTIEKNISELEK